MKIALGTAQFGLDYGIANTQGRVSEAEGRAIVELARARGVDTIDTAMLYGDSEAALGRIGVAGWQVVSKLPAVPAGCEDVPAWVDSSIRGSLTRLGLTRLDGLLLHRPAQLLDDGGRVLYEALERVKARGLVRKIGVSIYDPCELDRLCASFAFDLVQAPFNLLDRRLIASGWLARLADQGTELHVRSIFLQGLLLMPRERRPPAFARWDALWRVFHTWLDEAGVTPLQACLRDALSHDGISRVVVGVDSRTQLTEILDAAGGEAPPVPDALETADTDLLNPAQWPALV